MEQHNSRIAVIADPAVLKTLEYDTIKTHFFLRRFYQKHGFRIDQRWGGLVRHL